uniref:No apical meristem-associated C-terminal domain-containing protein n=1 Tax=Spongospora subterranea TaxID=70186 RepID=A0A0H5QUK5_9EUKA|eukprot:CRZ05256.1 hypothetical protein [Spongospora subterranea]
MLSSPAPKTGRLAGQPNFKEDEDVALAKAFVKETTCAAVGTDQSGDTFWEKIRISYMGLKTATSVGRSAISLSNRWNNTINKEVAKWIGHLTASLREYHSGWQYADYIEEAQVQYSAEASNKKRFKHLKVYDIISRLPKFAVPIDQVNMQVKAAIGLDCVENVEPGEDPVIVHAERPSIGKKAAKKAKFNSQPLSPTVSNDDAILLRIAQAAEVKNAIAKNALRLEFFKQCPESNESKMYFKLQAQRMLQEMQGEVEQDSALPLDGAPES